MSFYQFSYHYLGESGPWVLTAAWLLVLLGGCLAVAFFINAVFEDLEE